MEYMVIRAKWVKMKEEQKCQYNGYNDFFKKESDKIRREEREKIKESKA